jgi:hypothetical protein
MRLYHYLFHNDHLPNWFVSLNKISLSGMIAWPVIFFVSLFMFDDPNANMRERTIYWVLLNCYPLALLLMSWLSLKTYRVNPVLAAIFPAIPVLVYTCALILGIFFA